ncbi:hypothetical protein EUA02_26870 [Mycobacterium paragordonae]|uniref:hypothetical protein n=1 Tax=Mycobacterium paragordonae TaxID=1389713 RepID=UPI00105D99BF|nr:hypothetical protein [Mycobacterium paragordonae]TDK87552.1 hypothetical protein EUA02_26870 [Mycobacterium paragordonae]TDL01117.1 hypothetical protein EUA05_28585 [Mycobacterium paragordonae]
MNTSLPPSARAAVETLVKSFSPAAGEMMTEAAMARVQYPPFNSPHEGYAVLREEVDELWDDVKADRLEASIAEAVQVGAMAMRYVTEMRARLAARGEQP